MLIGNGLQTKKICTIYNSYSADTICTGIYIPGYNSDL